MGRTCDGGCRIFLAAALRQCPVADPRPGWRGKRFVSQRSLTFLCRLSMTCFIKRDLICWVSTRIYLIRKWRKKDGQLAPQERTLAALTPAATGTCRLAWTSERERDVWQNREDRAIPTSVSFLFFFARSCVYITRRALMPLAFPLPPPIFPSISPAKVSLSHPSSKNRSKQWCSYGAAPSHGPSKNT